MSTDTIVAISTGGTNSGINIIRISGEEAKVIISKIFNNSEKLSHQKIIYGKIIDPETTETLDEVLVSCFVAPNSYTGEDVFEINTHGGRRVTLDVLNLVIKNGARIAEAGEFSKRAFLNGKMDLSKAEAVIDLINSKTKVQKQIAVNQLEGGLSEKVKNIRNALIELIAQIEVNIDYPEYDYEELSKNALKLILERQKDNIYALIRSRDEGKFIKDGIDLAIVGGTNSGKSSLLNQLANEERAIVTDIEGTTRDIIEESLVIGNLLVNVSDTAGIRETEDIVESIGIKKSLEIIEKVDLIIYMIDSTKGIKEKDEEIINEIIEKKIPVIICVNKIDISREMVLSIIENLPKDALKVGISAKTGEGIEKLKNAIQDKFDTTAFDNKQDKIIVNERHKSNLEIALQHLNKAIECVEREESIDISAIEISETISELGKITGEITSEDIVNKIFEKFCLGK
ncbi:MAG: tRNA uridine-5-carboxymethylaminomethyl(34) synthesis GTPase MnmE [Clostridia bacterium]|nr:tRNA uridine-5-carboxymethylaminomethyl(34) synthesis GTPase MnmE [Clostridia bacterium]